MLEKYLPINLSNALNNIPYNALCELRLRAEDKTIVNISGRNFYLNDNAFSEFGDDAIVISKGVIKGIIEKISNNSMYTINDDIINGYVTINGGIRVGVCGEVVSVNNSVTTIKNVSSLNFRFPHFIKNCSLQIYPYIVKNGRVKSTLIISPPGAGKTTMLRDLIYQISDKENLLNLLVVDERGELTAIYDGENAVSLSHIDVYSKCTKNFGFVNGIRSMRPDVIFTDEINLINDIDILEMALTSGVSVITSIHANNIKDLKNKTSFRCLINKYLFERYVVLSADNGVGTVDGIYDENFNYLGN